MQISSIFFEKCCKMRIDLQNSASIQPRTSTVKFARSSWTPQVISVTMQQFHLINFHFHGSSVKFFSQRWPCYFHLHLYSKFEPIESDAAWWNRAGRRGGMRYVAHAGLVETRSAPQMDVTLPVRCLEQLESNSEWRRRCVVYQRQYMLPFVELDRSYLRSSVWSIGVKYISNCRDNSIKTVEICRFGEHFIWSLSGVVRLYIPIRYPGHSSIADFIRVSISNLIHTTCSGWRF